MFLLVVLVPAMLLMLFLPPISEKNQLILHKDTPSLLSLFANHFTHLEAEHFMWNVIFYIILVIPIYILNFRATQMEFVE
jgi:hypothetical protein